MERKGIQMFALIPPINGVGFPAHVIKEGTATIKVGKEVFYNQKMVKLRDVSVIFLKALGLKKARLLDATTATGVRGIRYALEAGIGEVTMLDINPAAYRNARSNARLSKAKVKVIGKSLQEFAGSRAGAFDVIDLDPFGSPAPLIYDALRLSGDGTVLMVTATDTATLCGAERHACLRIYGARPVHNELCHEGGVRILLSFIAREAAQFNFGIEPLLSIADMHYMRVFLRLRRGANEAVASVNCSGPMAYCSRCHNFTYRKGVVARVSTECAYCGNEMQVFGPMWLGNLKNDAITKKMAIASEAYGSETGRFAGALADELDLPFFYSIPKITSYLKSGSVPISIVMEKLGERAPVSRTHFEKCSVKTPEGISQIIEVVKGLGGKEKKK
jgi:tRNA (guanine26-N2/guanine27-N2)-dimethyltransferase